MSNLHETLSQAQQYHQSGNLDAAETLYRQVLHASPGHATALYGLGVVALNRQQLDVAIGFLRDAGDAEPSNGVYRLHLGTVLQIAGQLEPAADAYRAAIRLTPTLAPAHEQLGRLLATQGKPTEAIECYQRALQLQPHSVVTLGNLAAALIDSKRGAEAIPYLQTALQLEPGNAELYNNLALVLLAQHRYREAEACCREAIRLNPLLHLAHNNLGAIFLHEARFDEAAACFRESVRLQPSYVQSWVNLGGATYERNRLGEAAAAFTEALQRAPRHARALDYMSRIRLDQGNLDESLTYQERAVAADPNWPEAHLNLGLIRLLRGDFARGWPEYEWRFRIDARIVNRFALLPHWDGRPMPGKTILIHAEQGLGDTLQFVRYAPLVRRLGARTIVACQPPLVELIRRCEGVDTVLAEDSAVPPTDAQVSLLELPARFGTDLATIPGREPYIDPPADLVEAWRQRLGEWPGFRIGIAWQGNPRHQRDRFRSVPLALFEPLSHVDGVRLISLQRGAGTEQILALDGRFPLIDLGSGRPEDMREIAALVKNLDLVVTVDCVHAHLAGAMGVPVWVALPALPDWRWLLDREDSPWYPSMRLFRQARAGEWPKVFERLTEALRERITRADR